MFKFIEIGQIICRYLPTDIMANEKMLLPYYF